MLSALLTFVKDTRIIRGRCEDADDDAAAAHHPPIMSNCLSFYLSLTHSSSVSNTREDELLPLPRPSLPSLITYLLRLPIIKLINIYHSVNLLFCHPHSRVTFLLRSIPYVRQRSTIRNSLATLVSQSNHPLAILISFPLTLSSSNKDKRTRGERVTEQSVLLAD